MWYLLSTHIYTLFIGILAHKSQQVLLITQKIKPVSSIMTCDIS